MSYAPASPHAHDIANRRLLAGLLLSFVVHAAILSIQFGVRGMQAGAVGPISVMLAPPPPAAPPVSPPAAPSPTVAPPVGPLAPRVAEALPLPRPPSSGFQLRDPAPLAPPPALAKPAARQPARRRRPPLRPPPPREALDTPVIAQQDNPDAAFRLPLPELMAAPQPEPELAALEEPPGDAVLPDAAVQEAAEAPAREEEGLAAARADEERSVRERQGEDERVRLAAEQQRTVERERALALQRLDDERRAREAAALAEARRAAEEEAQRMALERRRETETAQQRLAEQAARQRELEEEARRAEQIARRRIEVALEQRRREAEIARRQGSLEGLHRSGDAGLTAEPGPGKGAGGSGAIPRAMLGSDLALRARELMRGIDIPAEPPAALRPARQAARTRRAMVASNERDVPLRMYVDSFRQKIERNAAQIQLRLSAIPARVDPIVSVAVRSDGSIDEVTILRSSGRADTDDAVRRIVHLNARYAAFPPNVAARFDVIEIRRIWTFAETLKLLEEVR